MKIHVLLLVALLGILVDLSVQWSGNVCYRPVCVYVTQRECRYRTWYACCSWRYYRVATIVQRPYCCRGWTFAIGTNQQCTRAICNPPCRNGGTCVRPNQCRCRDGSVDPTCSTLVCNYQRPCFPGTCQSHSNVNLVGCTCTPGFQDVSRNQSDFCRKLEVDQMPVIFETRARMSFWPRGMTPSMEKYALYVDSSDSSEIDSIWTNRKEFNWINVTARARYDNNDVGVPPAYISSAGIGIVKAEAHLLLKKVPYTGSTLDNTVISLNMTIPCDAVVSDRNPVSDIYNCSISKPNFDRSLENADNLTITFRTSSGGFRVPYRITPPSNQPTQLFIGRESTHSVQFMFDFLKPSHDCAQGCTSNTTFYMERDVTKSQIRILWSDWTDVPSGMFRYAWEVFKLQVDGNQVLREPNPLGPVHGPVEVMHDSTPPAGFSAVYTPTDPGVYSFILEASDKANNSVFVRRIAIYDPVSSVTIDAGADNRLYISSADPNGGYNWQDDPSRDIKVTWTNHFVNLMHEEGKWLNQVLAYPPQLEDYLKKIPRDSGQDDHEGQRTVDAIPNRRGVVKFEVVFRKDSNGGKNQQEPITGWVDVGVNETFTIRAATHGAPLTNRDTVTVWVRATDVLGNNRIETTRVHFDNTPPDADQPVFKRNTHKNNVPFSSTVEIDVLDMQSGLKRVDLFVRKVSNNQLIVNETLPFTTIDSCPIFTTCYCASGNKVCFNKKQFLSINNCWLKHPMLEEQTVTMEMNFVNMAGIHTTRSFNVTSLNSLTGTQASLSPQGVTVTRKEANLVTVAWKHSPSCYSRTDMWINYEVNGQTEMIQLHKATTSYNLVGLQPDTTYTIVVISQYGELKSRAVPVTVTTESGGLSSGAIVGVVIGMLLLLALILVIVGLILFKLGLLAALLGRRNTYREQPRVATSTGQTTGFKRNDRRSRWAFDNTTYTKDDDIYIYGSMDLGEPWYVPPEDISLTEVIATGKFARIYTAKWMETPKNVQNVVAKVLKVRESQDDILLMLAKINFAATQMGKHTNLLGFLGAVMENEALGPVMVLEYCEIGQLDKWLTKQRSNINEDTLDRMQNFALDIARAMEYLASKKIVHRKLAARNCLLTFLLEIKVTGCGPSKADESADDAKGDRIPIKWTAPECLRSFKDANEKSDVWSYGVTIWEIFSMGESPYSDIRGRDIPTKVKGGHRLSRPEYAEDIHYRLMQECWSESPGSRPNFSTIVSSLESSFGLRPDGNDQNYYYQR